jgi:hypothetical protein
MLVDKRIPRTDGRLARGGRRPWIETLLLLPLVAPFLLIGLNCSQDDSPTQTHDALNAIAGGGRGADDDPFNCGPDGSGPNEAIPGGPDFDPSQGLRPLVYLDDACGDAPATVVIQDTTAWRAWWEANVDCGGRALPADSGWVDPDSVPAWDLPYVDFTNDVVVAITLERVADDPRMLVVEGVADGEGGTTIRYTVYHPGEDCVTTRPDSSGSSAPAPAVAVLVPRPVDAPFTWMRDDTTYSCSWEPDPDTPLMLYYTDAPCELGANEQILTDQDRLDAWLESALACDMERWGVVYDSIRVPEETPTDPPVPVGYSIPVDFERFAVIVLRAGEQERWGGGIWLTDFRTSTEGTWIEYAVIQPGAECPPVGDSGFDFGTRVNPTVAIRVPLPLPEPVHWERSVRTIDCDWGAGGDSVVIGWDSTGTGPERIR